MAFRRSCPPFEHPWTFWLQCSNLCVRRDVVIFVIVVLKCRRFSLPSPAAVQTSFYVGSEGRWRCGWLSYLQRVGLRGWYTEIPAHECFLLLQTRVGQVAAIAVFTAVQRCRLLPLWALLRALGGTRHHDGHTLRWFTARWLLMQCSTVRAVTTVG